MGMSHGGMMKTLAASTKPCRRGVGFICCNEVHVGGRWGSRPRAARRPPFCSQDDCYDNHWWRRCCEWLPVLLPLLCGLASYGIFSCYNRFCTIRSEVSDESPGDVCIATIVYIFCYEVFGEISVDVSDEVAFATIAIFFYEVSAVASGKVQVRKENQNQLRMNTHLSVSSVRSINRNEMHREFELQSFITQRLADSTGSVIMFTATRDTARRFHSLSVELCHPTALAFPFPTASASASMDPRGADLPCIVQALASASMDHNDAADRPCIVQALAASPSKPQAALPAAARDHPPPPPPNSSRTTSPRRTRSGGAPEWTAAETLALVATVAAVDDDGWARSVSAFQKWAIVADNLAASAPSSRRRGRAAGECKRRWEALVAEYGAVRRAGGAYWGMGAAARRKAGLPAEFDAEVYGIMDALIQVEEAFLAGAGGAGGGQNLVGAGGGGEVGEEEGGDAGVGEEEEVDSDDSEGEMQVDDGNVNAPDDLDADTETYNKPKKSQTDAWELANKLNQNAQHIHMLLNGEADGNAGQNHVLGDAISPYAIESTRQKADELIKSLGGLVSYLNQFTDLIKENGIEDVVGAN